MNKWIKNISVGLVIFFAGAYFGPDIGNQGRHNVDPWGFASTVTVEHHNFARYLSEYDNWNIVYANDLGVYYEKQFKEISSEPDDCDEDVRNQIQVIIEAGNAAELIDFLKRLGKTPIREADREKKVSLDGIYLEAKRKQLEC